jgi:hypothetical protein
MLDRITTISKIVTAMELYEQLDMQFLAARGETSRALEAICSDSKSRFAGQLSAKTIDAIDQLFAKFSKECSDSIMPPEEIVAQFCSAYGADMRDDELAFVLCYYTSPVGRKDVLGAKKAIAYSFGALLQNKQEKTDPLMRAFSAELEQLIGNDIG